LQTILLDPELRAKLNGLDQPLEIRDDSGKTVGHFVPIGLYEEMVSAWVRVQFADDQERAQAREEVRTQGGLTTAEAIAHLEQVARGAASGS
jgi:hypothetical protein